MTNDIFLLSPTSLREFLFCPRRAGMSRIGGGDESSTPPTPALLLSLSLHAVLAEAHHPARRCEPSADDLVELLSQRWRTGYVDSREEDAAFDKAASILRYYRRSTAWPQGEILATEAPMSCVIPVGGRPVQLKGRADRVELFEDGTLEILDYKVPSGDGRASAVRSLTEDLPSFLYFFLAWRQYRLHVRVRDVQIAHINMVTLHKSVARYDQRQIKQNRHALAGVVMSMMNGEYEEARPTAGCMHCPVKLGCPAWAQADLSEIDSYPDWKENRQKQV